MNRDHDDNSTDIDDIFDNEKEKEPVKPGTIFVARDPQNRCKPEGWVVARQGDGTLEGDTVQLGLFWHKEHAELFAKSEKMKQALQECLPPCEQCYDHAKEAL